MIFKILKIQWQDRVPNSEVLHRAQTTSITSILSLRRLRWLGHVYRMSNDRIPKQLLFGELKNASRPVDRPKLRFKDVCKDTMKQVHINHEVWENLARNRPAWREAVRSGVKRQEVQLVQDWEEKRRRRKRNAQTAPNPCRHCDRPCRSNIGRFSHERKCRNSQSQLHTA